jgi:hypothetical protein
MLKQFIFAFLAAILLMAQISLLSCTPSTCIVGAPARELMPTPLLAISDFLLNYQMINIKLLHLIGQLTVVAELLLVVYWIISITWGVISGILSNFVYMMGLFLLLLLGFSIHQFGIGSVVSWLFELGRSLMTRMISWTTKH